MKEKERKVRQGKRARRSSRTRTIEEFKEGKEFKEKDRKGPLEGKVGDGGINIRPIGADAADGGTQQRLAALEHAVQQLVHFIGAGCGPI